MRIFGGHDYYDSALSLGIDPTIVMVREKNKNVPVKSVGESLIGTEMRLLPSNDKIERVSIVFCGKLYRGAIAQHSHSWDKPQTFWSASKLRDFAAEVKNGKVGVWRSWYSSRKEKAPTVEDYFTPVDAPEKVRKYMIDHKIAILMQRESHWGNAGDVFEVNPIGLKQLGFAKALDPYTAFQELSMWIGGILGGTSPEMVRITDDKVLIENHGYDKHSFRSSTRAA